MSYSPQFNGAAVTSQHIRHLTATDDAGKYACGRGVRFTLEALGIPHLARSETGPQHGHTWDDMLRSDKMQEAGWQEVDLAKTGWTPEDSPPGVVWVYDRNNPPLNNGRGAQYGHVEIAIKDGYASGGVFNNPGGSVRGNEVSAFVHPKLTKLMGDEPISADFARETLERAHTAAIRREQEFGNTVVRNNNSTAVLYDLNNVDLDNLTGFELLGLILSMFFGVPLTRDFPVVEGTADQDPAPTPDSDPKNEEDIKPDPAEQDQPDQTTPESQPLIPQ